MRPICRHCDTQPVTITVSGDTVTGVGSDDHDEIGGSVLVQIVGPVSRVEIDYDNSSNANQWLWVTDIHFQAVPEGSYDDSVEAGAGDDTIDAGLGADTVYGEGGDDTILVGSGDTAFGDFSEGDGAGNNDGDDTFIINPDQLTGDGEAITIHGGEALDDSDFDTLDFNGQLLAGSIIYSETDHTAGGLSGTAELLDGTIVTFTGIEEIICFASGTNILTDTGEVAIEHLTARPDDFHPRPRIPAAALDRIADCPGTGQDGPDRDPGRGSWKQARPAGVTTTPDADPRCAGAVVVWRG